MSLRCCRTPAAPAKIDEFLEDHINRAEAASADTGLVEVIVTFKESVQPLQRRFRCAFDKD